MSKYTIFCPKYTGSCPNCTENCPNSKDIFGNFDNLSPLKIQSQVCENKCARIFLLSLLYPELFWKNYIFFQNLDRNTSGFHLLLTWGVQIWTETLIIWTSSLLDWSEWLLSSTPTIKMPQRRDNAGAVCNSGMGMLFLCVYVFYIISLRGCWIFFMHDAW